MSASALLWPTTGVRRVLSDRDYRVIGTHAAPGALAASSGEVRSLEEARLRLKASSVSAPQTSISVEVDGPVLPEWIFPALKSATELLSLDQDWDSYGSPPIDPRTIERGLELLGDVMSAESLPPAFVPTSSGGCQLEWHTPARDLEIEILADGNVSIYLEDRVRNVEADGSYVEHRLLARELLRELVQEP